MVGVRATPKGPQALGAPEGPVTRFSDFQVLKKQRVVDLHWMPSGSFKETQRLLMNWTPYCKLFKDALLSSSDYGRFRRWLVQKSISVRYLSDNFRIFPWEACRQPQFFFLNSMVRCYERCVFRYSKEHGSKIFSDIGHTDILQM